LEGALVFRDFSEQRRHEQQLADLAGLRDLSSDAIFTRDLENRITYWSKGAVEAYGYTSEEAIGQTSHGLLQTVFPDPLEQIDMQLERAGRWTGELIHTCKDGSKVFDGSRWALARDGGGNPISILETNTDITARKETEAALHRAHEQLADRSHQLETLVQLRTTNLARTNEQLRREIAERQKAETAREALRRQLLNAQEGCRSILPPPCQHPCGAGRFRIQPARCLSETRGVRRFCRVFSHSRSTSSPSNAMLPATCRGTLAHRLAFRSAGFSSRQRATFSCHVMDGIYPR
jgi:PAS domain S-box-containing protein